VLAQRDDRASTGEIAATYSDGVWLVDLAAVSHPDLVLQAVAAASGVRERRGEALLATLLEALSAKRAR